MITPGWLFSSVDLPACPGRLFKKVQRVGGCENQGYQCDLPNSNSQRQLPQNAADNNTCKTTNDQNHCHYCPQPQLSDSALIRAPAAEHRIETIPEKHLTASFPSRFRDNYTHDQPIYPIVNRPVRPIPGGHDNQSPCNFSVSYRIILCNGVCKN